jgi:hypothetical protein
MRFRFLLIPVLFFTEIICNCQGVATIRNIDFVLVEGKLIITYDIIDFKPGDRFNILPEIYKSSDVKINAISFTGDLKEVAGGPGKKISWEIGKDNLILDEDIYVIITGEIFNDPVVDKPIETQRVIQEPIAVIQDEMKTVSRAGCFFESIIFPGWGTSRLTLKKGNLVKGFLGYGAIIGSLILNNRANDSYDLYLSTSSSANRDIYYDKSNKNIKISNILAGGAIAIWSIDLISVLAVRNKTIGRNSAAISINIGYTLAVENSRQIICRVKF